MIEVPKERPTTKVKKWRAKNPAGVFTSERVKAMHQQAKEAGAARHGGGSRKGVPNGKTKTEVAQAVYDAAPTVVQPKELPADVQERTGITENPLHAIELMCKADLLAGREKLAALKTLAEYTHSKAPSISESKLAVTRPEDFLAELAGT